MSKYRYGKCNYILLSKWFLWWKKKIFTAMPSPPLSYCKIGGLNRIGWNICHPDTSKWMMLQMFQLEKGETIALYPRHIKTWEGMGKWLGLFPSKGQARKAGFHGKLPTGFTAKKIKQKHCWLWLYIPPND